MSTATTPPAPAQATDTHRRPPPAVQAAALVALLTAALAVVFVAFAWPGLNTQPRDVPLGLAGLDQGVAQVQQALTQAQPGAFEVSRYGDAQALRQAIRDREVYGGIALDPQGATVLTASGGGPLVAQTITAVGQALGARSGVAVRAEDLAPLPEGDPRGLGLAGAALPIVIGGLLPAALLVRRFPRQSALQVGTAVAFALVAGLTLTAILQFWFGSIDTGYWRVALGLALGISAISLVLIGLERLLGMIGFVLGAGVVMLLGNPLSGLASAPEFLPSGWGALGQLLPPGANATLLRSNAYFEGAGGGRPAVVLACWALLGLVLVIMATVRRRWGTPAEADAGLA